MRNKDVGSTFVINLDLYVLNANHQDAPYNLGKIRSGLYYISSYKVSHICGYTVASSGWECHDYGAQFYINFNGVYDIENSNFANNNGTNLQYDLLKNGIWRIPARRVATFAGNGFSHETNSVCLGSPENQDATEFEDKRFIEPQTDEIQTIENHFSLNQFANESWHGYFDHGNNQWGYGSYSLCKYNLSPEWQATLTWNHPLLVIQWTPFDQIQWPNDTINEYPINPDTSITGQPTNLYGPTQVIYADTSNQGNDPEYCDFYNYIINRTWQAQAGAYNFSNSPSAIHVQSIGSEDTQPPYLVSNIHEGDTSFLSWHSDYSYEGIGWDVIYEDSASSTTLEYNDVILQGSPEEMYILARRDFTSKDVCENQTSEPTHYFYERKLYTDIPEYSSNIDVSVYPNPTSGNINIKYDFKLNEKLKTELYNTAGQKLEQRVYTSNSSSSMDLSKYSAGIYFLKSKTSRGIDVDKVVKYH